MARACSSPPPADRLPFLDALRGLAAAAVVLEHGLEACVPGLFDFSLRFFNLGQFGVTLFLLISGFIIPVSLERGGSNFRFWVNRLFRLFPLYWATIGVFCLYYLAYPDKLHPPQTWQWFANLTMLQEFFQVPHVAQVFWTLTLELTFYASCSLLYALGLSRRTQPLVGLGFGILFFLGICCPLVWDRRFPAGYAFLFLTMFVGTLFHRWTTRDASGKQLALLLAALAPASLWLAYVNFELFSRAGNPFSFHCVWCVWLGAYMTFVTVLKWRIRAMPALLTYLGRISYSIYLMHTAILLVLPHDWPALPYLCMLLGGTLALSSLTYRWIEQPFMKLGRRLLSNKSAATLRAHRHAAIGAAHTNAFATRD